MPSLGEAISALLREHGLEETVQMHRATSVWKEVVGPGVARHCRAQEMMGHTLYVRVRSAAWRNEIAFQKDIIIQALNERIGSPIVRDIRFK